MSRSTEFQFAHPRGVRPFSYFTLLIRQPFQFTHLRGVRRALFKRRARLRQFQFTHPRGVRQPIFDADFIANWFQFTYPRGVRPRCRSEHSCQVSFQFTHPRGVRLLCAHANYPQGCFNSRTREGCDHTVKSKSGSNTVSIHAPARGATALAVSLGVPTGFQFTHPRGVRRRPKCVFGHIPSFNSRTREGYDRKGLRRKRRASVSIHAPARDATAVTVNVAQWVLVSIHAPARGATFCRRRGGLCRCSFNSRTREGCDGSYCIA